MNADLFSADDFTITPGAVVLRGFALPTEVQLLQDVDAVMAAALPRHMTTPGGFKMSAAMTNCGAKGWITDRSGYRYAPRDPLTDLPWPPMPGSCADLARRAADRAGFAGFDPDSCLINRYEPGAKMSLHQDRDERDFSGPIVSVSLGLQAIFLFGGLQRSDRPQRVALYHGDVVVWGGPARLNFHGIAPIAEGNHPILGRQRINLTLRRSC